MRKIWTMFIAIALVGLFLFPKVSLAEGRHYGGHDQRDHSRIHSGNHSLFTIAATAAGFVIGGFLNAPAYWGDPYYRKDPGLICSGNEMEYWTEDSEGNRYWVRTGSRYRGYPCD